MVLSTSSVLWFSSKNRDRLTSNASLPVISRAARGLLLESRARLPQHHVRCTFPSSRADRFSVGEVWFGAHLLFSVRAECWVTCSKLSSWYLCSPSILFLFRMFISPVVLLSWPSRAISGRATFPGLCASTPPLSFSVYFTYTAKQRRCSDTDYITTTT